ncbi:MAG: DUF4974 domain-containing protein [Chitinophaga sp.]|uniref:FecR family protein n=1 Tax=Chitinophaga sp. TaxID=1869181 RepID=UPI001B09084B|nr:FecR domain-containing protein [Chitinophaga sp.]MBO9732852.1 DUF4974 domain-containing protein [Chitinophaga sp.]
MANISVDQLIGQPSFINYCFHANEDDVNYWTNWVAAHPEYAAIVEEATDMVKAAGWLLVAEKEKPAAMAKMDAWLLETSAPVRRMRWYYPAAAAAVLLLAAVWYFRPSPVQKQPNLPVVAAPAKLYYHNTSGAMQGFVLPDSSYVLLENGTSLQLDSAFGRSTRSMALNGTAYFKVSPDPLHRFQVTGGSYMVTALGTAFRMTATQGKLQVLLETGKVMVENSQNGIRRLVAYLQPTESLLIDPSHQNKQQQHTFTAATLNAWKAQEMVFDHTPVSEVLLQLEASYNIQIQIKDSTLQKEVFSGRFKNDALSAVLDVLCFTLNKQYQFIDSTNVIIQ